jgi:hypothetical protein
MRPGTDENHGAHGWVQSQPAGQGCDFVERSEGPHRDVLHLPRGTIVVENEQPFVGRDSRL